MICHCRFYRAGLLTLSVLLAPAARAAAATQTADGEFAVGQLIVGITAILGLALIGGTCGRRIAQVAARSSDRRRLRGILKDASLDLLEDFILPGAYGGLTHIDHAVRTSGGLFCIRTKFCDGTVSGAPDQPQWSVVGGGRSRQFLNPLIQNEGRSRALQNVVPDVPIANVVVFRDSVEFATPMAGNVVRLCDLGQHIATHRFPVCDPAKLDTLWRELQSAAMTDDATRKDCRAQLSFS